MQTPKMREPISTLSGRVLLNEDTKSTFECYAMEEVLTLWSFHSGRSRPGLLIVYSMVGRQGTLPGKSCSMSQIKGLTNVLSRSMSHIHVPVFFSRTVLSGGGSRTD